MDCVVDGLDIGVDADSVAYGNSNAEADIEEARMLKHVARLLCLLMLMATTTANVAMATATLWPWPRRRPWPLPWARGKGICMGKAMLWEAMLAWIVL